MLNSGLKQKIDMTKLDGSNFVEVSFWAKLTDENHNKKRQTLAAKIACEMTHNTRYIPAVNGCGVVDDKWFKYSGVADLRACKDPKNMQINIAEADPGIVIHLDQVSVTNYSRDRSWRNAASLRIEELRTQKTIIDIRDPKTKSLEINMIKNAYPFGATMNKFMMADDYNRENWPIMFNYAVSENEHKWRQNEKKQYQINYNDADEITAQMKEWNIPIRGHAVTWSVNGKNPDWFEENPTLDALYNRTDDVVQHFAGDITQWDVLNEPLHGRFFKNHFGENIWDEIFDRVKKADPNAKLAINDYSIVRADKGRCFNDLTSEVNIDYAGLQSHIHPGLNGHFLKHRFDTLAYDHNDPGRRLFVTEFDIDNDFDFDFKANDLDDLMRSAFSHPAVDGIIMWKWLWSNNGNGNNGPVSKHFFDTKDNPAGVANETWPYYPNEAGKRWIDLVKGEWNSTQVVSINGPSIIDLNLFYGDYEIIQRDQNGDVLHTDSFNLLQTEDCTWSAGNLVSGEFDNENDMSKWELTGPNFQGSQRYKLVNFGAYAGNCLQHSRPEAGQIWLSTEVFIDEPGSYTISFMAKWDALKQLKLAFGTEEVEILSHGEYGITPWTKYEVELNADNNGLLVIEFFGVKDRFYIHFNLY